jgi:hypothetical protein
MSCSRFFSHPVIFNDFSRIHSHSLKAVDFSPNLLPKPSYHFVYDFGDKGQVLFSLNYRLAPETKLPEIAHDVEDAFDWIRRDGPRLLSSASIFGGPIGLIIGWVAGALLARRKEIAVQLDDVGLISHNQSGAVNHTTAGLVLSSCWR